MEIESDYCVVIEPNRSWFRLPWRDLLHYRDLWFLMVRRDFVAKYKQTVLGPIWYMFQPLMTAGTFTIVFGRIAKISTDNLPQMLFYMAGMVLWNYFSQCVSGTSTVFVANARLFGKVYFPRLIVPLAVVTSNLIGVALKLFSFAGFWLYFQYFTAAGGTFRITAWVLLLPLFVLQTAALGLGVGLWMTSLTAKYRDLKQVLGTIVHLWMYVTPVIYPLSEVPARWRWAVSINPMTGITEATRYALLGAGTVNPEYMLYSALGTILLLVSGVLMFSRTERTFIDTV